MAPSLPIALAIFGVLLVGYSALSLAVQPRERDLGDEPPRDRRATDGPGGEL